MLSVRTPQPDASQVLRELARIEPEVKKTFTREARDILRPMVNEAKASYPDTAKGRPPLRGINYAWNGKSGHGASRPGYFPYEVRRARAGVKFFVNTSAKRRTTLGIRQTYGPAVILENAGKKSSNALGDAITSRFPRRDRFMWKGAEKALPTVNRNIRDAIERMIRRYNRRTR